VNFAVHEPTTLDEALGLLAAEGDGCAALAGGTDLLMRIRRRARKYRSIVNLKRVPGLNGIRWDERSGLTLGALTTFRAVETHPIVRSHYPALIEAARTVAGVQLRNLATIGGNLGNASPSADSVPPLMALGATVDIASPVGVRTAPIASCVTGPGRTALAHGELFESIRIQRPPARTGSAYLRFSPRSAMDIGIASVAAVVTLDADGRCASCRIALGAVSPTPLRADAAESRMIGEPMTPSLAEEVGYLAATAARPISDIRGSADYRRAIVRFLTARTIALATERARATA
jgi:CO/xanthine dehydrogenase FAD-binding subunit